MSINPNPPHLNISWHDSPEAVHRIMWEEIAISNGLTYDQLQEEATGVALDMDGNEVEVSLADEFDGMRKQGCWAFVDTKNNQIHAWAANDTAPEMVLHMLAHEIGHATGEAHSDPLQEEMRAEQFGRVARLAYEMLGRRTKPACTSPECGCSDSFCMAWEGA